MLCVLEYYLEDAIELTHFIAPPKDKKKKNLFEEDDREEVASNENIGHSMGPKKLALLYRLAINAWYQRYPSKIVFLVIFMPPLQYVWLALSQGSH